MATAPLLGFELSPRIKDINDQTLYKIDRQQIYPALDPILSGTIKPNLIRAARDETVRVIASIEDRIVSPKVLIQDGAGSVGFHRRDYLRDLPPLHLRSFDHSDRTVVLLDHDFNALPDLLQHAFEVASGLGIGHSYHHAVLIIAFFRDRYGNLQYAFQIASDLSHFALHSVGLTIQCYADPVEMRNVTITLPAELVRPRESSRRSATPR